MQIGGDCSLCGAKKANKATCPLNPLAKNPNSAKHNKSQKKVKSIKKNKTKQPKTKTLKRQKVLTPNIKVELVVYNKSGKRGNKEILKHHSEKTLKDFIKDVFYGVKLDSLKLNKKHTSASFHVKLEDLKKTGREYGYLDNPEQVRNIQEAFSEIYTNIMDVGKNTSMKSKYGPTGSASSQYSIEILLN